MKTTFAILLVLLLITLGFYVNGRVVALTDGISLEQMDAHAARVEVGSLGIAAYNIAHGRGSEIGVSNWSGTVEEKTRRLAAIGKFLSDSAVDIVVLNEVDFDASWSGRVDQALLVAEAGNFPFVVRQTNFRLSLPGFSLHFGNALLSRYPIRTTEHVSLPPLNFLETYFFGNHDALRVSVELDSSTEVEVWGLHLEVRDQPTRVSAAKQITEQINVNKRVVLVGDYNSHTLGTEETQTALSILSSLEGFNAIPEQSAEDNTFPAAAPTRTLDWILYSSQLTLVQGGSVSIQLSDHLPVIGRLQLQ